MASSFFVLLDDLATILDDVALMTKVAAKKTAGVLGDDLALNAEQVSGVTANRELPVVFAVFKGSIINKLILVPFALLISYFEPRLIIPLLMIGGAYLCFEGAEKIMEKFFHHDEEEKHAKEVLTVVKNDQDLVKYEKDKIKGAVRTDFILSAEIVAIALGTVSAEPFLKQVIILSIVAFGLTFAVYGLVAGIVKMDDVGFWLDKKKNVIAKKVGYFLIVSTPYLMKSLSVIGTIAMFLVGGSIVSHGIPAIHHIVEPFLQNSFGWLISTIVDMVIGLIVGVIVLGVVHTIGILKKKLKKT